MKHTKRVLFLIILLAMILTACGGDRAPTEVTGTEKEAVLVFAEPMTDNLLKGMNEENYELISKDFNSDMSRAITKYDFYDFLSQTTGVIGKYVSREVAHVEKINNTFSVIYTAKFEKDDPVDIRVVFSQAEPHQIMGLWFNSAKIKEQTDS